MFGQLNKHIFFMKGIRAMPYPFRFYHHTGEKIMPTLVVIDVQKEYTTAGRPFYLKGIEPSLNNAKKLLELARLQAWDVVHIQHFRNIPGSPIFNRDVPEFSGFVDGFEPSAGEQHFEKSIFSCYSNPEFAAFMEAKKSEPIYVVGYGTSKCVLATAVAGCHLGHKLTVVSDATYCKAEEAKGFSEETLHQAMVVAIGSSFAQVESTADLLAKYAREDLLGVSYYDASAAGPILRASAPEVGLADASHASLGAVGLNWSGTGSSADLAPR